MTNPVWTAFNDRATSFSSLAGPPQEAERQARFQHALDDARLEYALRRLDVVEKSLGELLPALRNLSGNPYALLLASALVLEGRLKWRLSLRNERRPLQYLDVDAGTPEGRAFTEAVNLFRANAAAIPAQPGASRLYTDFGIALHRTGRHDEALSVLEQAAKTGAAPAEAFGYTGMAHVSRKEFEAAIIALNKGLQLAPGDRTLLETLAITHEMAGIAHYPEAVQAYCQTAIAAGKEDDQAGARESLRAALRLSPHDPQALSMYILLLRSQGESEAAMAFIAQTLQSEGTDPWALGLQGMLLREAGRSAEAIAVLRKIEVRSQDLAWTLLEQALAAASSDIAAARQLVGRAAKFLGEQDEQVAAAKVQVEAQAALAGLEPIGKIATGLIDKIAYSGVPLLGMLGQGLSSLMSALRKTSPETVTQALQSVVKIWPDSIEALQALANLLLQQNELVQAGEVLDKALARAPDAAPLLSLKAQLFDAKDEKAEALALYRQAARAAPDDDNIFFGLVAALTNAGRNDDALYELDRKLSATPGHTRALSSKGALLTAAGRFAEAKTVLEEAEHVLELRGDANLLAVRVNLGCALRGLDLFEESAATFDRAIAIERQPLYDARGFKVIHLVDIAALQQAADLAAETIALFQQNDTPEVQPRLGWLHAMRGWALRYQGATAPREITAIFRTALRFLPGDFNATTCLAEALQRDEDAAMREEADQILTNLTENTAAGQVPLGILGWCYFLMGRFEAAEHWLRAALPASTSGLSFAMLDDAIATRFNLALVLLALDQPKSASVEYEAAGTLVQQRPMLRQRGLLHVAAFDLIEAVKRGIVSRENFLPEWKKLRTQLAETKYPIADLDSLAQP